jgi:predicted dehydrogenase
MAKEIGFGVIGYGLMGTAHISGLQQLHHARVVAIAGPNQSRAQSAASKHNVPKAYTNEYDLIADPNVEAVIIASPDDHHHPQTMATIAARKHVFVEKPIALNVVQAREMHTAAKAAGVQTGVGFTLRWNPLMEKLHAMVKDGELGTIVSIHAQRFNKRLLGPAPTMEWRYNQSRSGSGVLGDLGSHMIDLAQYIAGPITSVSADLATTTTHALDAETQEKIPLLLDDDAALIARFASGAHGTISSSRVGSVDTHLPLGHTRFMINGTEAGLVTDGILHATIHRLGHPPQPVNSGLPLDDADHAGILAFFGERMMRGFLRSIRENTEVHPTLTDGLKTQEVVDAAIEAARTRRWINVPQITD